ncbi:T9SS type A sorting domain-containing protein [Rubricoccus marinus]|uniref:Secretion system C-terminal sorting domain-containing protein n=1 Tax=Rubricoccus marinus TaxID=716817 RepID=A0A259TY88_9BACT|nr:T9SS type A sorting domain-containing protein [Rubricoccus marinus]OZC02656.1 hypothetical protein BSZ36_06510 [Rubricoccus marinus]
MTSRIRLAATLLLALATGAANAQPALPEVLPSETLRLASGDLPPGFDLIRFYPTGTRLAAGDINGDGRADVVYTATDVPDASTADLSDRIDQTVVYFGPAADYTPGQVVSVRLQPVGDVTGDGFSDAFSVPQRGEPSRIYRGSPDGYVEGRLLTDNGKPVVLDALTSSVRTAGFGDMDGDGLADLATVQFGSRDTLTVVLGVGNVKKVPLGGEGRYDRRSVSLADIDGDDRDDVIFYERRLSPVTAQDPLVVRAASLGPDGVATVRTLLEVPRPIFTNYLVFPTDADADGDIDLLVVRDFSPGLYQPALYLQESGSFDPLPYEAPGYYPAGDVDGDGVEDGAIENGGGADISAIGFGPLRFDVENRSARFASVDPVFPPGVPEPYVVRSYLQSFSTPVGDVDGDGRDDIVLDAELRREESLAGFGRVTISSDGSSLSSSIAYLEGDGIPASDVRYAAGLGDVNGDGVDDFAVVHRATSYRTDPRVEVFMGGNPFPSTATTTLRLDSRFSTDGPAAVPLEPERVVAGDVDGDGERDIAVAYPHAFRDQQYLGGIAIWLGGASLGSEPDWSYLCTSLEQPTCEGQGRGAGIVTAAVGDANGDGVDDLFFGGSGKLMVLLGGEALPSSDTPLPEDRTDVFELSPSAIPFRLDVPGDVDQDGFADAVVCQLQNERCNVVFGAVGGFADERSVLRLTPAPGFNPGISLSHADVNGDGASDIITANALGSGSSPTLDVYYGGPSFDAELDVRSDVLGEVGIVGANGSSFLFYGEITALPDLDNDGDAEILIGGGDGRAYSEQRDAFVVLGGTFEPSARLVGPNPSRSLGVNNNNTTSAQHSAVGDFNGDGIMDAILVQGDDDNDAPESDRLYFYSLEDVVVSNESAALGNGLDLRVGPNPVGSEASVQIVLTAPEAVTVEVFDALGRRLLASTQELAAGTHRLPLDARTLASGVHVVRVQAGEERASQRITVVR